MAEATMTNGFHASSSPSKPAQLSFPMPHAPHVRINIHLSILQHCILLFLATSSVESGEGGCSMGSFVYALPNRLSPSTPLSTSLYGSSSSSAQMDFATRIAKIISKKTSKPTYVSNSISFASTARGGAVEEEMDGLTRCVEVVLGEVEKASRMSNAAKELGEV
ncbi:hypothetical protein NA57DRAFT_50984 [Rhizodiscina lignyota]|uniref:Uncharacterized protein n=1 Tax=Rhizodiscina lignyota TaxID=1504668 RepID=A0A9P4MG38_9PEZI|nr:hypothetical protein NA57DRAFT_50984 [Rhizodiscina lignyota]